MSDTVTLNIDGKEIAGKPGQTILEVADEAGIYIPRLCAKEGLTPAGSCRVCTVLVNGRAQAACTQPIAPGIVVENASDQVREIRRRIIEMLFVEGNHFCMFCEKSGNCELQALAYRLGITAPRYPFVFPKRELDASHPDILLDRDRCILCGRCVRTSAEIDRKHAFGFAGRGRHKRVAVDAEELAGTRAAAKDAALDACPVGALLVKRTGYRVPVGRRRFDHDPIGTDIERRESASANGES